MTIRKNLIQVFYQIIILTLIFLFLPSNSVFSVPSVVNFFGF